MLMRNTMSREMVKLCSLGEMPWLKVNETGKLTEESKRACDDVYLKLGGKIFYGVRGTHEGSQQSSEERVRRARQ